MVHSTADGVDEAGFVMGGCSTRTAIEVYFSGLYKTPSLCGVPPVAQEKRKLAQSRR